MLQVLAYQTRSGMDKSGLLPVFVWPVNHTNINYLPFKMVEKNQKKKGSQKRKEKLF